MTKHRPPAVEGLLEAGRRRWPIMAAVFIVLLAGGAAGVLTLPPLYQATATVLVERAQVPEAFVRGGGGAELEARLQTIQQEVLSRSRLQDLIQRFDLYPALRPRVPMEALVMRLRKEVKVDSKAMPDPSGRGATISFSISYQGGRPETVADVANAIAAFYVERSSILRDQQASGTAELLKKRLQEVEGQLGAQEARMTAHKARHAGGPHQTEASVAALERLHARLSLNTSNQMRVLETRAAREREGRRETVAAAAVPRTREERLAHLRETLADLRRRFSDKYPDVAQVSAEIAALERQEPGTGPAGAGEAVDLLARELAGLEEEEQRLRGEIAAYEGRIQEGPRREEEYLRLTRDYAATKDTYESLLRRHADAQLAERLERGQQGEHFRVLDPAIVPHVPAAPPRLRLLMLALFLALAAAAAAGLAAEHMDDSFHDVAGLQAFARVSVLGTVPPIRTAADRRRTVVRWAAMAAAVALAASAAAMVSNRVARDNETMAALFARGRS